MPFYKIIIFFILCISNFINLNAFNLPFIKANFHELNFYKYGAVLPILKDSNGNKWVYFTLDIHNKKTVLDIFGGLIEKKDKTVFKAAIREFNEESLDVFSNSKYKKLDLIDYKTFRTQLYIISFNNKYIQQKCDSYIKKYYSRRFGKVKNYNRLSLAQAETVGMRKVKLVDLIDFIESPSKYPDGIEAYYSKANNCLVKDKHKFRFESKILLLFSSLKNSLENINKQNL